MGGETLIGAMCQVYVEAIGLIFAEVWLVPTGCNGGRVEGFVFVGRYLAVVLGRV